MTKEDYNRMVAQERMCEPHFENLDFEVFSNENLGSVRVSYNVTTNEPWFVAKDVCDCLGIKNNRDAVSRLDEDEKTTVGLTDTGSNYKHSQTLVSESGLYALIMSARKKEARDFQKWVTKSVLPSIRKNGAYVMGQELMSPEERVSLMADIQALREKNEFTMNDSNYWFEQWRNLVDEMSEIKEMLHSVKSVRELPNGGLVEQTEDELCFDYDIMIHVPKGSKYKIQGKEERNEKPITPAKRKVKKQKNN